MRRPGLRRKAAPEWVGQGRERRLPSQPTALVQPELRRARSCPAEGNLCGAHLKGKSMKVSATLGYGVFVEYLRPPAANGLDPSVSGVTRTTCSKPCAALAAAEAILHLGAVSTVSSGFGATVRLLAERPDHV